MVKTVLFDVFLWAALVGLLWSTLRRGL